ncbi:MAG: hypothetical protein ABI693_11610 [Bryobacteraceae bacterium]
MITRLLDQITKMKPGGFPDITVGAMAGGVPPQVALYPGDLTATRGDLSSEVRPRAIQLEIPTVKGAKSYPLDRTPLAGTVQCRAIYDAGKPEERRASLVEGDDYSLDAKAPAIALTTQGTSKLDTASLLRVDYSFGGIYGTQEFTQAFFADVLAATPADAERWSSLLLAMVLMSAGKLVETFNAASIAVSAGDFGTRSELSRIAFAGSSTNLAGGTAMVHLTFQAAGRLELTMEPRDPVSVIDKVASVEMLGTAAPVALGASVGE